MSILLVSLMMAAAMRSVAVARVVEYRVGLDAQGQLLAQGLMAEILQQAYKDPVYGNLTLGPDALELTRASYNDVDDYNGLTDTPPTNRDGTKVTAGSDLNLWSRTVTVEWVSPSALTGAASASDTHCKRITVTVNYNHTKVTTMVGYRTDAP